MPNAAALVMRFLAEGVPPGCGEDWQGFRWFADTLETPTRCIISARELEGWGYHLAQVALLETQLKETRALLAKVRALPGSANDAFISAS